MHLVCPYLDLLPCKDHVTKHKQNNDIKQSITTKICRDNDYWYCQDTLDSFLVFMCTAETNLDYIKYWR